MLVNSSHDNIVQFQEPHIILALLQVALREDGRSKLTRVNCTWNLLVWYLRSATTKTTQILNSFSLNGFN